MSKFVLIAFLVFIASSQALNYDAIPKAEQNLAKTLMKSSRSMSDSPQRNLQCFGDYMPKINDATDVYEAAYSTCIESAENTKATIEAEVAEDRGNVFTAASGICSSYNECAEKSVSYDAFVCYNNAAGNAISSSYDIQTISKNKMQYIDMRYQTVEYDQIACTDKCSNEYIQTTSSLHAQLEACLAGEVLPPVTSTSVPPVTDTTEPAPTEAVTSEPEVIETDSPVDIEELRRIV